MLSAVSMAGDLQQSLQCKKHQENHGLMEWFGLEGT